MPVCKIISLSNSLTRETKRTSLSLLSVKSKVKFGSAVQSFSGGLHVRCPFLTPDSVDDAHNCNCLLYAILIEQSVPTPVEEDTEEHVVNTMSIVPSLSERI